MKRNIAVIVIACIGIAMVPFGCDNPAGDPGKGSTTTTLASSTTTTLAPSVAVSSAEYIDATPGRTIRYKVTYPPSYSSIVSKPEYISATFQSFSSTDQEKRMFITAADRRESSVSVTINQTGIRYNGGSTTVVSSTLMQKLILPAELKTGEKVEWTVDDAWIGTGTYSATPLPSYTTTGGKTYADCMKVEFPSSKLYYKNQKGHGFYILARSVGIVHYEATIDTVGDEALLGAPGETVAYDAVSDTALTPRQLKILIRDQGQPVPGAYMDFNYGGVPRAIAGTDGIVQTTIYLPLDDAIGSVTIYKNYVNGRGTFYATVSNNSPAAGDIDMGSAELPPHIVSMTPDNGAVDVNAMTRAILTVTFSEPMDTAGYTIAGVSGKTFPNIGTPAWSTNSMTITIPLNVGLSKNTEYALSLNTNAVQGFKDAWGATLDPYVWTFTTAP